MSSMNATEGFRLSPQQKSVWPLQQSAGGQSYRAVCMIAIEGNLEPRVLNEAINNLAQRHEILRTTFQRPPGIKTPFQVVTDSAQFSWQAVDLTGLDQTQQQNQLELSWAEQQAQSFDFEHGPLLRATLLTLSRQRGLMIVALPAMCADSWTLANFVAELSGTYESMLSGQSPSGEPMQYADFAEWQNELLEAEDDQATLV